MPARWALRALCALATQAAAQGDPTSHEPYAVTVSPDAVAVPVDDRSYITNDTVVRYITILAGLLKIQFN